MTQNQNRCCHSSGLPPPETAIGVEPVSNTPEGRKKLVSATRSINCMIPAASRGGKQGEEEGSDKRPYKEWHAEPRHTRCAQLVMVAIKLTAPSSDEVISRIMPMSQND